MVSDAGERLRAKKRERRRMRKKRREEKVRGKPLGNGQAEQERLECPNCGAPRSNQFKCPCCNTPYRHKQARPGRGRLDPLCPKGYVTR